MTQKEIKKLMNAFVKALMVTTGLALFVCLMSWVIQTFEESGIIVIYVVAFLLMFTSVFYLTSEE
jgi:hypothetical protein